MIKRSYISHDGYVLIWSSNKKECELDSVMLYREEDGELVKIDQANGKGQEIDDNWEEYKKDITDGYIKRCVGEWGEWFFG